MSRRRPASYLLLGAAALMLAACYPPPLGGRDSSSAVVSPPPATGTATPGPPIGISPTPPLAATVVAISPGETRESLASRDGNWRADLVVHPCAETGEGENAFDELRLTETATGATRIIAHQLQYCGGLGAVGLDPLMWAANSRYLYYTDAREGVPDGGCGEWLPPLYRLDVRTGETSTLNSALGSPDHSRLLGTQGRALIVWDVEGGDGLRIHATADGVPVASLAWSPDGRRFAYLQAAQVCPPYGATTVAIVDASDGEQAVVLDAVEPGYGAVEWGEPGQLQLTGQTGQRMSIEAPAED